MNVLYFNIIFSSMKWRERDRERERERERERRGGGRLLATFSNDRELYFHSFLLTFLCYALSQTRIVFEVKSPGKFRKYPPIV